MVIALIIFVLLRIFLLTSLPIVNDESMYLHWGNDFLKFWNNPAMPLSLQGKQALTPLTIGLVQLLPIDPLIAGRLVTILFSLITFFSVAWITKKNTLALLLVATSPLLLFFDRLALPDSIVTALYTLTMALAIKQKRFQTILIGLAIAVGWWFKSTALLAIPPLLFSVKASKHILLSICIALILSLGLGALFHRVAPLAQTGHVFTLPQLLAFPWQGWVQNIIKASEALLIMSSPLAIVLLSKLKRHPVLMWFLAPMFIEIFLAHIFNLRYITIVIPAYIILISMAASGLKRIKGLVSWSLVCTSLLFSLTLITKPLFFLKLLTPIPAIYTDINQYMGGWSSGWGVRETADYLIAQSKTTPVVVFVRNDSGNPEDGMYVYLRKNKNINVLPIQYRNRVNPSIPAYFVSRGTQMAGLEKSTTELVRFNKPLDVEYVGVYRIQN